MNQNDTQMKRALTLTVLWLTLEEDSSDPEHAADARAAGALIMRMVDRKRQQREQREQKEQASA